MWISVAGSQWASMVMRERVRSEAIDVVGVQLMGLHHSLGTRRCSQSTLPGVRGCRKDRSPKKHDSPGAMSLGWEASAADSAWLLLPVRSQARP